jgi:hypothetical protein
MKKVFTKLYPVFVMLLMMAMYLPASAQFTKKNHADNVGATALGRDAAGNVYVLRHTTAFQPEVAGTAEVVRYNIATGDSTVLNNNLGQAQGTDGGYESGTGIAVDGNNNVYVTSYIDGSPTGYGKIQKLSASSGYATVTTFYAGSGSGYAYFGGLAIDSHNNLYVTAYNYAGNSGNGTYELLELPNVTAYTNSFGGSVTSINSHIGDTEQAAYAGSFAGNYTPYSAITVDGSNNVFVGAAYGYLGTAGTDGGILYKFPSTGNGTFGTPVQLKSNFYGTSLAIDPGTGNLYGVVLSAAPNDVITSKLVNYGNSMTGTNTATTLPAGTDVLTGLSNGVDVLCWGIAVINSTNLYVLNGEVPASGKEGDIYQYFGTPATQASNIIFSNIALTTATISWTNGSGSSRAVFVKNASSGTPSPANSTTYTANVNYGSGTQAGSGWY